MPGYYKTSNPLLIERLARKQILFRPEDARAVETALELAYERKGWTIYIDEVYGIGRGTQFPPAYIKCLTRGRSRGITVWTGMQRPRFAPLFALTESTHFFVFRLTNRDDRKRVADFTDDRTRSLIDDLEGHEFIYHSRHNHDPIKSLPLQLRKDLVHA